MPLAFNYYVVPVVYSCENTNSHSQEFKLPLIVNCNNLVGTLLKNCSEQWNNNLGDCDKCFYIPFENTDKYQIQTTFFDNYNTDPESPVNGWGSFIKAEIYDCSDALISDDYTTFSSRAMVAHNGSNAYQILEIDLSLVPDSFYIKFQAFDSGNNVVQETCTQHFAKVICKEKTVLIRSEYTNFDNAGNYYGSPLNPVGDVILFDNSLRVHGFIREPEITLETTTFNRRVRKVETTRTETGVLTCLIPPYMNHYLIETLLSGENTYFDGNQKLVSETSIALTDFNNMFIGTWQMTNIENLTIDHTCN